MFLSPIIRLQGISGWAVRSDSLIFRTASPRISNCRSTADGCTRSSRYCSKVRPATNSCSCRPARTACQRYAGSRSSGCINQPMSRQDRMADKRVNHQLFLDDVGLPAEDRSELRDHLFPSAAPRPPVALPFLEYHQDVDVAVGAKLFRVEHGPEETELPDTPLAAER